ncbi:MAG: sulfite exporter TauE/SafE family protein [Spirochaetota bacterium]|nr:sulfite exporter TauE/SafE family protein [Spirochaetota bacterium]
MYLTISILLIWASYMFYANQWYLFIANWDISVTMLFGSVIAGASSEGGGAIAFPVMTLIYKISPEVARNFSLAIQSIGMTCASCYIFCKKISIDKNYLFLSSLGGTIGIILGVFYIAPDISPSYMKMLFFSFWLSFAFIHFYLNHLSKREVINNLPDLCKFEKLLIMITALMGGILTSILGSGIDIITFSFVTMRYGLSEKVATPTSVIIMTINSIIGFLLHSFVLKDFGMEEFNYWLVCIPVVIFGAPIGVFIVSRLKRIQIAIFLYIIIIVQFVGACFIIKLTNALIIFSIFVFIFGMAFFFIIGKILRPLQLS